MVRFIILSQSAKRFRYRQFTFHYGQIYYYTPKPISYATVDDLHSTMVRFIIIVIWDLRRNKKTFTFHYGQIYYLYFIIICCSRKQIYIPLWLDLLLELYVFATTDSLYLHSTMVRFIILKKPNIISNECLFTFHYGQIYYNRRGNFKI